MSQGEEGDTGRTLKVHGSKSDEENDIERQETAEVKRASCSQRKFKKKINVMALRQWRFQIR